MSNCPICKKNKNDDSINYIYKNHQIAITHAPINANILGYLYIEPVNHYENWADIPDETFLEITRLLKKIDVFLRKELNAERVYSVTISEMVRHIHFHLIPRYSYSSKKGVDLIEKATQQLNENENKTITESDVLHLINKLQGYLN
ncbi:HIT family protein [Metabacillus indicus]|uniref:HIT family protein n=1 Tax=Metabacillus indicus TaxID=246786 RepID=UPI000552B9F7|nr:HIT domain-containing protein [Metabacillus indicus]